MEITAIGEKNESHFLPLLNRSMLLPNELYLGAVEDQRAAGAIAFSGEGETVVIHTVFVPAPYRRRGIGSALLDEVFKVGRQSGAKSVWMDYPGNEANDAFLQSKGFLLAEDVSFYRIPIERILTSETCQNIFSKITPKSNDVKHCKRLCTLSDAEKEHVIKALKSTEIGYVEDLIHLVCDPELSLFLYRDEEGRDLRCLLLANQNEDAITILYLANPGGNPKDLVLILKIFMELLVKKKLTDKDLTFCTGQSEVVSIFKKFVAEGEDSAMSLMVAYGNL